MKRLKLLSILVLLVDLSYSQETKDTLRLSNVEVVSSRLKSFGTANKVVAISGTSALAKNQTNLRQILASQSSVNIRAYGVSGLSTVSFRGTGSNHSAIFWEGVNLQSPMNGGLDLTLLPISFVDDVQLQLGASGALFGAGTLGGSIQLKSSQPIFEKKPISISLDQQIGSFGQYYQGGTISLSQNNIQMKVRAFRNTADNNFEFYNRFVQRNEEQENAAIDQHGVLIEPSLKLGKNGILQAKYWYQDNTVQIPKTASEGGISDDIQKDRFHRSVLTYTSQWENAKIKALTSFLNHRLRFNQAMPNISNSWISEFQGDLNLRRNVQLQVGVNHTYEVAEVRNYGGNDPRRNQTALFASVKKLFSSKMEATLAARQTYVDGELTPFVPSLGLEFFANRWYSIKAKVAKSFRLPTFNDLYWVSGTDNGNPDLTSEQGINLELGHKISYDNLDLELTAYSNHIDNWIQWRPNDRGNWSPINVLRAWTRGIEFASAYTYRLRDDLTLAGTLNYTYTRATSERVNSAISASEKGKDLIYVPRHQGAAIATINWKKTFFMINQTYTGRQFTTSDNKERWALDPFALLDVAIGHSTLLKQHSLSVSLRINNIMNQAYEIRSAYPMPGINYNLNLNYIFN
ncbi:MAG: TonB-dependent receptor [Bacteroidota bacterium]